jgi:hypothetical protein
MTRLTKTGALLLGVKNRSGSRGSIRPIIQAAPPENENEAGSND